MPKQRRSRDRPQQIYNRTRMQRSRQTAGTENSHPQNTATNEVSIDINLDQHQPQPHDDFLPEAANIERRDDQVQQLPTNFIARQPRPAVDPYYVGAMNVTCNFCQALRFPNERLNCCHNGKVILTELAPYPPEMHQLISGNNTQARHFQDNIRRYNSAFAFASFGAQISVAQGRGPYSFRIHGQIYHRSGTLHPHGNDLPSYSQLYILEGHQAVEARMQQPQNKPCQRQIMNILSVFLKE